MGMRKNIMKRLAEDLVGPYSEDELLEPRLASQRHILQSRPGDVYLSGILWPQKTKVDPSEDESLGTEGESDESDFGPSSEAEQTPFANMMRPSSAGLSFATKSDGANPEIHITVSFGMYIPENYLVEINGKAVDATAWRRRQININKTVLIDDAHKLNPCYLKAGGMPDGIYLYFKKTNSPVGELVSISLVNGIELEKEANREIIEKHTLFQAGIRVTPGKNTLFVSRPSRRSGNELEDRSANLLYRTKLEFATGHTCAAEWIREKDGVHATQVSTTWLPYTKLQDTNPNGHEFFHKLKGSAHGFPTLFFRMLTGKMPFEGEDDMQVYGAIMQETPEYSLVPAMFRPFMQHCFKKDSKDRHQNLEEMKAEFINAVKKFTKNHARYSNEEPIPGSPFSGSYSRTFPKYTLRKEPIKVSEDDFEKVFGLNYDLEPLNYINNEFQDNGDDTVTDYATGLMWQKSGSSCSLHYSLAKEYVEFLNEERFAEYNDWRLPTIPELMSILKFKKNEKGQYIDLLFNQKQTCCWSADTSSGWVAWYILFIYGSVYWHFSFNDNYVRAVRLIDILTV